MPDQSIPMGYRGSNGRVFAPDEFHKIECGCENVKKPLHGLDHNCGRELWEWTGVRMALISEQQEQRAELAERERIQREREQAEYAANKPPPPPRPSQAELEERAAAFRRQLNPNAPSGNLFDYLVLMTDVAKTPPPPAAYMRADGETILPEGKLSALYGMPSVCKSFIALDAARAVTRNGGRVLWWDHEDTKETLLHRADAIGYCIDDGLGQLAHVPPALIDDPVAMKQAALWVNQGDVMGMVVIDACNSAGCPSDGSDVSRWFGTHVAPWGKDVTILLIDHIPKREDDRAPGQIGSVHKRSMLTGVGLLLQGKAWDKKNDGRITLTSEKDRHSVLPAGIYQKVAAITGTHVDGVLQIVVNSPTNDDTGATLRDKIVNAIMVDEPTGIRTMTTLIRAVGGKAAKVRPELDRLIADGVIARSKDGKADVFHIAIDGEREIQD